MKTVLARIAAATTFALAPPAMPAVVVELVQTTHHEAVEGTQKLPPDSRAALQVVASGRTVAYGDGRQWTLLDFAARKRIVLEDGRRADYSLYDIPAFRMLELQNRVGLAKMLAAAKVDVPAGLTSVFEEHVLATQLAPGTPLTLDDDGTDRRWRASGRILCSASRSELPADAATVKAFAQFVRYAVGAHPQILAALDGASSIPKRLVVTTYEGNVRTTTLDVGAIRPDGDAPPDPARHPLRDWRADTELVERVLDRGAALTAAEIAATVAASEQGFRTAIAEGRGFDALLAAVERNLTTGVALTPFTPDERALIQADPRFARMMGSMNGKTKEESRRNADVLAELAATGPQRAHVLRIFEANERAKGGEPPRATKLLLEALEANPAVASAWKDLGDKLLLGWDAFHAWRSWDIGRRIGPDVANFRAVDDFERRVAAAQPAYFP